MRAFNILRLNSVITSIFFQKYFNVLLQIIHNDLIAVIATIMKTFAKSLEKCP